MCAMLCALRGDPARRHAIAKEWLEELELVKEENMVRRAATPWFTCHH